MNTKGTLQLLTGLAVLVFSACSSDKKETYGHAVSQRSNFHVCVIIVVIT